MSNQVQDLLDKNGVRYTNAAKDFVTKCFNPEHEDRNPSFRIDKVTGVGHCFSCGFKFNIFKHYGVITNTASIKLLQLKAKLRKLTEDMFGLEYPDGYHPFTMPFRGISVKTLRKFEAFYTDKDPKLEDRIVFPCKDITGKITAFIGRHTLSSGNPRYVVTPIGANISVTPSKLPSIEYTSIVLVEGIFDMLNLYDKGMHNAICCYGTSSIFNNLRENMLPFKAQGIHRVFIMFDGDEPGNKAADKLKPLLEELDFSVEIIKLEEDTDPGDMSQEDVDSIIEYTK